MGFSAGEEVKISLKGRRLADVPVRENFVQCIKGSDPVGLSQGGVVEHHNYEVLGNTAFLHKCEADMHSIACVVPQDMDA